MGNLMCTGRQWCDLIVWTFKGYTVIRIPKDDQFITEMKLNLADFYANYFKRAVLDKFMYRSIHKFASES